MFIQNSEQKLYERLATLYKILLVKSSALKDHFKKHYLKKSLLTHPDACGDEKFCCTKRTTYFDLTWQKMI